MMQNIQMSPKGDAAPSSREPDPGGGSAGTKRPAKKAAAKKPAKKSVK